MMTPATAGAAPLADEGAPTFDPAAYLERIGDRGPLTPSFATLARLHLAHLRSVPFENLDIARGRPLSLAEADLFDKIVRRRRGGFCFELNGLFATLLRRLGFTVTLLAASFPRPPGQIVPELDHLTLLVDDPAGTGPWLTDVGAGRGSPAVPLDFVRSRDQVDPVTSARFRLEPEGDAIRLLRQDGLDGIGDWERQYRFTLRPRSLIEFEAGSVYHQTSPDSHFTQGRICTRLTPTGRITLSERRLITTSNGIRHERELADEGEARRVLLDQFGIDLDIERGGVDGRTWS